MRAAFATRSASTAAAGHAGMVSSCPRRSGCAGSKSAPGAPHRPPFTGDGPSPGSRSTAPTDGTWPCRANRDCAHVGEMTVTLRIAALLASGALGVGCVGQRLVTVPTKPEGYKRVELRDIEPMQWQ